MTGQSNWTWRIDVTGDATGTLTERPVGTEEIKKSCSF